MAVVIGHARKDENGYLRGGTSGDSTGSEVCIQSWYDNPWEYLCRPTDKETAKLVAKYMKNACLNNLIGYDQDQRTTITCEGIKDPALINTPCECDCSSLVEFVCCVAGIFSSFSGLSTRELKDQLVATGKIKFINICAYNSSQKEQIVETGDILIQPGYHTCIVINKDSRVEDGIQGVCVKVNESIFGSANDNTSETLADTQDYLRVYVKLPESQKLIQIKNIYLSNASTLVRIGKESLNKSSMWCGWTLFESGVKHGQVYSMSNMSYDGTNLAYGTYQFDFNYSLHGFLTFCYNYDRTNYSGFRYYVLNLGVGSQEFITKRNNLHSLFVQYSNSRQEEFLMLQDKYFYDSYLAPGINVARSLGLKNMDNPYVIGVLGSLAIREGPYSDSRFGSSVKAMVKSGKTEVLPMLKYAYDYMNSYYSPKGDYRWYWDNTGPWGSYAEGYQLQTQYANYSDLMSLPSLYGVEQIEKVVEQTTYTNVVFVGDSRTLCMGTGGTYEYKLVPDQSIFATWGGLVTDTSALVNAQQAAQQQRGIAVFWYGVNDVQLRTNRDDADAFMTDYARIIEEFRGINPNSSIYVLAILTTSTTDVDYYPEQYANILNYNRKIQSYCNTNGYNYLNIMSLYSSQYLVDTIHFNSSWYTVKFLPRIKQLIGFS